MSNRWIALPAALVTMYVVTFFGVVFFFGPIAEADAGSGLSLSPALGLLIYCALSVILHNWLARRMKGHYVAAFVIGASQYILVLDLSLRGERGLATTGASAVLIAATWTSVAFVSSFIGRQKRG